MSSSTHDGTGFGDPDGERLADARNFSDRDEFIDRVFRDRGSMSDLDYGAEIPSGVSD